MTDTLRRISALTYKETLQILRDRSTILLGVVLPLVLIILIGSGVSLDVKNIPLAIVVEQQDQTSDNLIGAIKGSTYFEPIIVRNMATAKELMHDRKIDGILVIPGDFGARLQQGQGQLQGITYGVDTSLAMSVQNDIVAAVSEWAANDLQLPVVRSFGYIQLVPRMWFNDAYSSTWFFVPGLIMLIMTIVGVFLTSVVMAREWERGTFESLFVTPVKPVEIILAKIIPYYVLAMVGMIMCLLMSYYVYQVPMRGSLAVIFGVSTLYLIVSLNIGLLISAVTKSQFLSCQMALLVSFLPALMLTGFLFDVHSQPLLIQYISQILPATYYLQVLESLFLSGNNWALISKKCHILSGFALVFTVLTLHVTRKKVG